MTEIYKGDSLSNAGISINYGKKKKVEFNYPTNYSYKMSIWKLAFPTIFLFFMILLVVFTIYLTVWIILPLCLIDVFISFGFMHSLNVVTKGILSIFFIIGSIYLLIPVVITIILAFKKDWIGTMLPWFGYYAIALLHMENYKTFNISDVKNKKVTIPAYYNIVLNYEAEKDFSKYLKKVDVIPIDFMVKKRVFLLPFLKATHRNDGFFKAVFSFSDKPQNGKLIVRFI